MGISGASDDRTMAQLILFVTIVDLPTLQQGACIAHMMDHVARTRKIRELSASVYVGVGWGRVVFSAAALF